jgi:HAD superfamily hydrolase (TIGR01509 family)
MPAESAHALIFDCDGTLADTMPAHYVAWTATLARHGLTFPEDRFYALGGMPSHRIIAMLAHEQGVAADADAIAAEKEDEFLKHLDAVREVPEVVAVARAHRGRRPMAVASGGFRPVIGRILMQLGMAEWFDAVVTAEDTARYKPEPDVFLEAARRLRVAPAGCVVYEDTDLGLEAARRAGMRGIDIRPMRRSAQSCGDASGW